LQSTLETSESVKLEIAVTVLCILGGNICEAVRTYERGSRGLDIGWDRISCALLKRVWSYSVNVL